LSPTATEDLFAIGAGSQVAAVDDQSNFPTAVPKSSLSGYKPDAEAIAKYNPDLVVVADDTSKIVEQLTKLGVPVLFDDAAASIGDAYAQISQLGTATGHADQATALVADMKQKIAAAVSTVGKPTPLKYYYEVGNSPYYSSTSKTFIGSIFAQFGLADIADAADKAGSGYPQLSDEYIVTAAPDLVFLADTKCCQQNASTVAARPGWSAIPAVKNATAKGTVVGLDDDIASRWGPRLVDLVQQIAGAVTKAQG
jgi:iron complex transport system substrate-binding protein